MEPHEGHIIALKTALSKPTVPVQVLLTTAYASTRTVSRATTTWLRRPLDYLYK